jgi:hypothetical protein
LLLLLLLALLHYECCNMMSLLLLFFLLPCRKSLPVPGMQPFTFPHAWKFWSLEPGQVSLQGPDFYGMEQCKMSHSGDRKILPAFGNAKGLLLGTQIVFWHGGVWKRSMGVGKKSWYQQRDCQSLVRAFSDGKLKQKAFFTVHSHGIVWHYPNFNFLQKQCSLMNKKQNRLCTMEKYTVLLMIPFT